MRKTCVALRKESVDRNAYMIKNAAFIPVALRKESVDRNEIADLKHTVAILSLSARRAWIEIKLFRVAALCRRVALRKESVDRNQ